MAGLVAAVMAALSAPGQRRFHPVLQRYLPESWIRPAACDREMVRVGRFASFMVLVLAAVISPVVGYYGIFKFFQFSLTAIAIPFMATALMGILWTTRQLLGGLFGLVGGVLITATLLTVFQPVSKAFPNCTSSRSAASPRWSIMIGIGAVTLADRPARRGQLAPYVWNLRVLQAYDDALPRPWYQQVKLWWLIVAVIWFYLYWRA